MECVLPGDAKHGALDGRSDTYMRVAEDEAGTP